jgi:mediator of RNA polymerase II transcription subunit 20
LHWQPNAGSTVSSQILSEVSQCVESINGVKEGRWRATLTFYKPHTRGHFSFLLLQNFFLFLSNLSLCGICIHDLCENLYNNWLLPEQSMVNEFPRDFLGISLPEQPNKYYFIIRGQRIVLEADSSIQTLMEKLQSYKTRVALHFDVKRFSIFNFFVFIFYFLYVFDGLLGYMFMIDV